MKQLAKIFAVATMLALASATHADLNRVGPVNNPSPPGHGFPLWYQDLNGMVLDICIPTTTAANDPQLLQETACLLGPDPTAPFTFPTSFPEEVFYHRVVSDPVTTSADGKRAILVLALEAAFSSGAAQAGQQIVFTRIRVTAGVPFDGDYVVIHPYGVESFPNVTAGVGNRDIVFSEDVGVANGQFEGALTSRVGPFLQHSDEGPGGAPANPLTLPFPAIPQSGLFLGDGATSRWITGSPFGTNTFQLCGPLPETNPNYNCYGTDLFTVTGRLHDPNAPIGSPLSVTRATFSRNGATSQVDVMARASRSPGQVASPKLTAGGQNIPPVLLAGPTVLGDWYAQGIPVPSGDVPSTVTVTNSADVPPTSITTHVVDEVTVKSASYAGGTLTVVATTSDKGAAPTIAPAALSLSGYPLATQTASNPGDPAEVTFTAAVPVVGGIPVPPAFVRVASSSGGEGSNDTIMGVAPAFAAGVPYAADDSATVEQGTAAAIFVDVLANDVSATNPAFGQITILPPGADIGVASVDANNQVFYRAPTVVGTATFRYTVANAAGTSNVGTVTVDVTPALNPIPTAVNDPPVTSALNVTSGQALDINVAANDVGNGGTLDLNSILITTAPAAGRGTATPLNDGTGRVRFVGGATAGVATFAYTIANTNGQRSSPATVTVSVTAVENLTFAAPAKCDRGKWQVRGTSNVSTGNSVTIYRGATAGGTAQVIGSAPVIQGAWQFQGNATCSTPISLMSTLGTKIQNIAVQVR